MSRSFLLAICLGLLVVLSGCVAMEHGRTETAGITVVKVPTAIASVVKADIYVENDRLVVTGSLRRMHEVKIPGHIDIVVCGPEELLEKKTVKVSGLSSKRKGFMSLPFTTHLNLAPPPGSKVTIRYHSPPFAGGEVLECI